MVAVKIPGAESIDAVAPARDPGVQASPEDFGAQVGASQQHFGDSAATLGATLVSLSEHLKAKREAVSDITAAETYNVNIAPELAKAEIALKQKYPEGGHGYEADADNYYLNAHATVKANMAAQGMPISERASKSIETNFSGRFANLRVGAVVYNNNADIKKQTDQTAVNVNGVASEVLAGNQDVDSAIKQVDGIMQGARPLFGSTFDATKKLAREQIYDAAINNAIAGKDPARARELSARFYGGAPEPGATKADAKGDPSTDDIYRAIYGQESGSGRNTTTSVTGARGGMQIQPGTWALYAKPGENIDNAADNQTVGRRIIDDLSAKAGGDPARIAVGYFSGPGNMSDAGSATPWKVDKADPTGKTVSSYVSDVTRRLGAADSPNTAKALAFNNRIESMDAVNRKDTASEIADDLASIGATGVGSPTLTAEKITRSLGPNAAADWQTARARAKDFHTQTQDFSTLPPEQMNARLIALAPKPGQDEFAAQDALHNAAIKKADAIMKLRATDPAESVSDDPEVKKAVAAAGAQPDDFDLRKKVINARLTAQERAGIVSPAPLPLDETQRLLLPINEAVQMEGVDRTKKGGPDRIVLAQQKLVKDLKEKYGPYADDVMREVLGQAVKQRDRLAMTDAAGVVIEALITGKSPGSKAAEKLRVQQEAAAAAKAAAEAPPPRYQMPGGSYYGIPESVAPPIPEKPAPITPSAKSIQILRSAKPEDQARLAGLFEKQFHLPAGGAQNYLTPPVKPAGTTTIDEYGGSEGWSPE